MYTGGDLEGLGEGPPKFFVGGGPWRHLPNILETQYIDLRKYILTAHFTMQRMESTVETMKWSTVTSPKYGYCIHTAYFSMQGSEYGRNDEMTKKTGHQKFWEEKLKIFREMIVGPLPKSHVRSPPMHMYIV